MKCPVCATEMDEHLRHGVRIDHCPACGGVWLQKGELDHLMAAVRPVVTLQDPDPEPVRPTPKPRPDPARGPGYAPRNAVKPARFEDRARGPRRKPGKAHRYGRKYSKRSRLKDVLEEIFDFD